MAMDGVRLPGLRWARKRRLWTQGDLSERAEVRRETVIRLESGGVANMKTARRLAEVLNVPPAVLLDRPANGDQAA